IRGAILGIVVLGITAAVWLVRGSLGQASENPSLKEAADPPAQKPNVAEVGPSEPRPEDASNAREIKLPVEPTRTPTKPSRLADAGAPQVGCPGQCQGRHGDFLERGDRPV